MAEIKIQKLGAGKKYRTSIVATMIEGSNIVFPVVDISVPKAFSRTSLQNLITNNPIALSDVSAFSVDETVPAKILTASFVQIKSATYKSGAAASGNKKATFSSNALSTQTGNYSGALSEWTSLMSGGTAPTVAVTYNGMTDSSVKMSVVGGAATSLDVTFTFTAASAGSYPEIKTGNVAASSNPFAIYGNGNPFTLVRTYTTKQSFNATFPLTVSIKTADGAKNTYSAQDSIFRFILNPASTSNLINTNVIKDIVIPVWRYIDISNNTSKWYYCAIKNSDYYIPSTASFNGTTYFIDNSNYYEVTSIPRKTTKTYTGYNSIIGTTGFGQPTISGTDTDLINTYNNKFGPDVTSDIYLYKGYSGTTQQHPIGQWQVAFAIARYQFIDSQWVPQKWINCSNSNSILNLSAICTINRNGLVKAGNNKNSALTIINDTINFNDGGTQ